ncbi:hypothetical protein CcaverHIS002_0509010 [Cutaneotrichosporon cavernicola]|nr:hypothetical protein CcaverHIS002_0509010 [Cutaneotrichosporon cavernicola]BEJ08876.1 hypothetical protein CcaverHIS641_0509700 [Cutaneotrichosporon cavernicola]
MVLRDCTHLTPAWFTLCVARRTPLAERTYAEELVFPDFGLPEPAFAQEVHAGPGFTSNPGRKVVNEPDVVTAIGRLLRTRGNGESLAHWSGIYPTFEGNLHRLIDFMWRNVSALEGPHDGAIMNHRFAGPGTLVLGFLPTTRI